MDFFRDKVVWITGASSGIGEAAAKKLAASGVKLVLSARSLEGLMKVKEKMGLSDQYCLLLPFDLATADVKTAQAQAVIAKFGRIDVLFNNAGMSCRASVLEADMELYTKLMAVNFFGTVALTKAVLPYMIEQQSGHIAVMSSVSGKVGTPLRSAYTSSKHALHGFFESLRAEVYKDNINITMVCAGYVRTQISLNALTASGERYNKMDENQKRGLEPEYVAERILRAIAKKDAELYVGGKEIAALYLQRFVPRLLDRILRKYVKKQ